MFDHPKPSQSVDEPQRKQIIENKELIIYVLMDILIQVLFHIVSFRLFL